MSVEDHRVEGDLATLREMGCVISLDDFGKGYSSLARLARLPVDVLKVDRDCIGHRDGDARTRVLVGTAVELGRTLGMDVVAEGVETPGQLAALRALGCRFLQGYLIGRPVPAEELPGVLTGSTPTCSTTRPVARPPIPWTRPSPSTEWDGSVDVRARQGAQCAGALCPQPPRSRLARRFLPTDALTPPCLRHEGFFVGRSAACPPTRPAPRPPAPHTARTPPGPGETPR